MFARSRLFRHNISRFVSSQAPAIVNTKRSYCTPPPPPPSGGGKGRKPGPPQYLQQFHQVLTTNPHALTLHKELTQLLALGDVERAGDCAAVLAGLVKKHHEQRVAEAKKAKDSEAATKEDATSASDSKLPPLDDEMLDIVTDKIVDGAMKEEQRLRERVSESRVKQQQRLNGKASQLYPEGVVPPSDAVEVTIIESSFETDVDESGDNEKAAEQEEMAMQVLEEYLDTEGDRWQLQRHAIAKCIVDAAEAVGVTADHVALANELQLEEFHHKREMQRRAKKGDEESSDDLNPFDFCNIVIRGNAPTALHLGAPKKKSIDEEVAKLKEKAIKGAQQSGEPVEHAWSDRVEKIVRFELQLHDSTMSYDVGLHETVSEAIDRIGLVLSPEQKLEEEKAAAEKKRKEKAKRVTGTDPKVAEEKKDLAPSRVFVNEIIKRLNEPSQRVQLARRSAKSKSKKSENDPEGQQLSSVDEAIAVPVLPFDFLIRMCLGFNTK